MLKIMYTAIALSFVSISTLAAFAEDVKAPSATAICGYQWREAKKADTTLKGRDAWNAFRAEKCGMKAKTRNDDAIKQYLEQHKTEVDTDENEERPVIVLAGFKKGKGK